MTFSTPLTFSLPFSPTKIRLGLGPIRWLLDRLGNPQDQYKTILITGTNGKGSVAAMTAEIMGQAGIRTGLYTSPHLLDFRERIRIGGRPISRAKVTALIREVRTVMDEDLTYFEFLTALAFLYFARERVSWAVLEVGLGGRLDATNVVTPAVSVISNITLEHQDYLGRHLCDIAREKAGIIKAGGICLTAVTQAVVQETLDGICCRRRARLYRLGKEFNVRHHADGSFTYSGLNMTLPNLQLALTGRHQQTNAALAIGIAEILSDQGLPLDEKAIRQGLRKVRWEGRLEILREHPCILVDGAHNPAGMAALVRALQTDFSYDHLILILGVLKDKDYSQMIRRTAPLDGLIFITHLSNDRALPAADLAVVARKYHDRVEVIDEPREALRRALLVSGPRDLICAAGSLYLVGEIKACLEKSSL